jgi:hypothetical protein
MVEPQVRHELLYEWTLLLRGLLVFLRSVKKVFWWCGKDYHYGYSVLDIPFPVHQGNMVHLFVLGNNE